MRANTPSELYELFGEYFSAGTIELLSTLYEEDAAILPAPGQYGQGKDAIHQALGAFIALNGTFSIGSPVVVEAGDIALLAAKWTLAGGKDAEGNDVNLSGQTSDVARRQPDGTWLFVIDCPFGIAV